MKQIILCFTHYGYIGTEGEQEIGIYYWYTYDHEGD